MDRRSFIALSLGTLTVAACGGPPGAAEVTVNATGAANMNRGASGDLPVTLTFYHLASVANFQAAAPSTLLSDASGSLGADLLKQETLILPPGGSATKVIAAEGSATAIGILAGLLNPSGKTTKHVGAVAPGSKATVNPDAWRNWHGCGLRHSGDV